MSQVIDDPKPPYARPPITEAVIAVHFASPLPMKWLETFAAKNKKIYPSIEELNSVSANFDIQTNKFASGAKRPIGRRMFSDDRSRAIMFFETQMSLCHLAPYARWGDLYADAQKAWASLRKIAKQIPVSFVSTRYINRIDIPSGSHLPLRLDEYFRLGVSLPADLEMFSLETFHVQFSASRPDKNCRCTVHFAASPDVLIDQRSFWLDIDCVSTGVSPISDAEMWERITALRQQKNEVFEACITPVTRRLFQ
ncbi:MAG TPA: TIGR04255 family protein [Roseiarcus sp.]|nr:TIGR04255 family protein [Roseiarcus sp.]